MFLKQFIFSNSSSNRLVRKNLYFFFEEDVRPHTHHISAFFSDCKRSLSDDSYQDLALKIPDIQKEIIDFILVHVDDMDSKQFLKELGQYQTSDLIAVCELLTEEFMANTHAVDTLVEITVRLKDIENDPKTRINEIKH
ncbi:hypothetical protein [Acinetobacter sp. P1(2025)]|uniref:hypothetical protein n=1 Tax=Acinetobacter sp. P1(2025) TaxID=3446120 RepID=UPI003F52E284